jgi:hypothetical protein
LSVQAVVTLLFPLPAFAAVLGASVKLIAVPLLTVTDRDSVRLAVSVTVPVFEFVCACDAGTNSPIETRAIDATQTFWKNVISVSLVKQMDCPSLD